MMLDESLWRRSGHMDYFKENMFFSSVEKHDYAIKPMSCPGAMLNYNEKRRSYKDLPLRICELGHVHRNENSGSLHGLLRVRSFVQDDAHIFCSKQDVKQEIKSVLSLFEKILGKCGLNDYKVELSLRGDKKKYLGSDEGWQEAENYLFEAVSEFGWEVERKLGEAKFYGPSLDLHIKDRKDRYWQCSSLQFDFNLPEKFEISYLNREAKKEIPYVLHRAVFGSLERFIGLLLEYYQGALPVWMAPVQLKILVLDSSVEVEAKKLANDLWDHGVRIEMDLRDEHINEKILKAQREKVPWMLMYGKNEASSGLYSLRSLQGEDSLRHPSLDEFV
ncbi:MAG: aminoacyl--tRNA ligase-related protein [Bacteriovoracaceae bacterium]